MRTVTFLIITYNNGAFLVFQDKLPFQEQYIRSFSFAAFNKWLYLNHEHYGQCCQHNDDCFAVGLHVVIDWMSWIFDSKLVI